jgi:hypothetical protein
MTAPEPAAVDGEAAAGRGRRLSQSRQRKNTMPLPFQTGAGFSRL